MTDTVNMNDVMTKIAQIRELSSRASTQHEAEVAAGKMAKLLLRYNLTLADIESHVRETNRRVTHEAFSTTTASWKQLLLDAVAQAHLCRCLFHSGGSATVVGHEHNLIVVRETWEWLAVVADNSMRVAREIAKLLGDTRAERHKVRWGNDFKMGFVVGINAAYTQMRREVKEEVTTNEWAIVPVLENEVAVEFKNLFPRTKNKYSSYRPTAAYDLGRDAGSRVNLGGQLGQSRRNPALEG